MAEVMRYKEDLYRNQQMDRRDAGRRWQMEVKLKPQY